VLTGKYCAACIDAPATLFASVKTFGSKTRLKGRWLCDDCWQYARRHYKYTPPPHNKGPTAGRRHGGGGYLPNMDEQLVWGKK